MGNRNVCISGLVLVMFLQTVFNLPVDAQDMKKDALDNPEKTGQAVNSGETGQTVNSGKAGHLDVGKVSML